MTLFKKLERGLKEATLYKEGKKNAAARVHDHKTIEFKPVTLMKPNQIKKLRLSLGLSQKEFANFLAVSHETVAKWEQGGNKPKGVALRLMDILANQGEDLIKKVSSNYF
ncbi:helix-turn-helix domain-containing protein [Spirobacillus cienkowskii]|uniref:helix-turn-helix domain-containing protein n=1 Tax=Spirobacillus cienkowskii TaxID=495820 RepID=UPI0030CD589C